MWTDLLAIEGRNLLMILLKFMACALSIALADKYVWNDWSLQEEIKKGNLSAGIFAGLFTLGASILR